MRELGALILGKADNLHITESWPSTYIPCYPWFQVCGSCSTVIVTIGGEKTYISGPTKFKPVLLKGQLYFPQLLKADTVALSSVSTFVQIFLMPFTILTVHFPVDRSPLIHEF